MAQDQHEYLGSVLREFQLSQTAGNSRGQQTKREIVARAAQSFSKKGFHGTSLRSIARDVGIDHSTLKHHFDTKEDLLAAVLRWRDHESARELIDTGSFTDQSGEEVAATLGRRAQGDSKNPELTRLYSVLTAEAGREGHPAREYLQLRSEVFTQLLSETIADVDRDQSKPLSAFSTRELAVLLISAWDGMQVYDALNPGVIDIASMVERLALIILAADK